MISWLSGLAYSKADFEEMTNYILDSDISMCSEIYDINMAWSSFIRTIITEAMSLYIPKFYPHSRQYPIWLTNILDISWNVCIP